MGRKPFPFFGEANDKWTPAEYDALVQHVLDEYWPNTTGLTEIKKDGDPNFPDAGVYYA